MDIPPCLKPCLSQPLWMLLLATKSSWQMAKKAWPNLPPPLVVVVVVASSCEFVFILGYCWGQLRRRLLLLYLKMCHLSCTPLPLHPSPSPFSSSSPLLINNFNCIHSRAAPLYYSSARKMCQQNIFANIFCTQETCSPIVETPSPPSPLCPALSALPCTDDVARCGFVFRFQFALQCVCVCVPWLGQTLALITRQQQRLTSICGLLLSPTYPPLSPSASSWLFVSQLESSNTSWAHSPALCFPFRYEVSAYCAYALCTF